MGYYNLIIVYKYYLCHYRNYNCKETKIRVNHFDFNNTSIK